MAHNNTVISQLLKLVPRHVFENMSQAHHQGQKLRKINRWSQFVALTTAQLTGRNSLRDIVLNLNAQQTSLYHLGCKRVTRTTLARVNERQPYTLYEALFYKLYQRCLSVSPKRGFHFEQPLYCLDSSLIDLSLKVFPWAHYAKGKAALKLHVALEHENHLPAFATITHGHVSDLDVARTLDFAKGSMIAFDRGYLNYEWFKALNSRDIYFVTRPRKNSTYRVIQRHGVDKSTGVTSDQIIQFNGAKPNKIGMPLLRGVGYRDASTGKHYEFITNAFHLDAKTVAEIYRQRWQIELFFKWIKQNLKIKSFLGTSPNAVMTQIWAALCTVLLIAYLKLLSRFEYSLQRILNLLQLNLFIKRDLYELLREDPPPDPPDTCPQMVLV